jgi:putative oxidoreductase
MRDLGLLTLRVALGGLLAGHGAQKLFGWFGGHGLQGTGGFFESKLGLRPGERWALTAGIGEFGGGMLTMLGFLHPLGPISTFGPMIIAWAKAHAGKPIWATEGGAELPLLNLSIATALILSGPGKFSADRLFGLRLSPVMTALGMLGVAIGSYLAMNQPEVLAFGSSPTQAQDSHPASETSSVSAS